jgi:RNA polymerase sigma-70 factor (ECF subfamily)
MPDTDPTIEALGDEALARRIADGGPGATDAEEAELYRRFAPRVRLYGRRHLRDGAAADDLAQDVPSAERRVTRRREALAARFMTAPVESAPSSLNALDAPRVAACLRALGERDRLVMMLTFYAERDAPRIAEDLGVSAGTIRTIRHRAMARLRECVLGAVRP